MTSNGENKQTLPLAAAVMAGAAIGWCLNAKMTRKKKLEEHRTITEKIRKFDEKFYEDGRRRADQMESIKQEIHTGFTK
ncbi:hypothetical protein ACFOGI_11545 [Virgibacillus xinjiangensis]|uniref:YtxH domain-containing protein n=1 Tax=Virgibacillus xinjiangensis TaxID=393090 RepID=A0ABV7CX68_9BACI